MAMSKAMLNEYAIVHGHGLSMPVFNVGNPGEYTMNELANDGVYTVDENCRKKMSDFVGYFATEDQVRQMIKGCYERSGYVIDPHTAVAAYANSEYKKISQNRSVIISTASPYKFVGSVLKAIDPALVSEDDFAMAEKLSEISGVAIPRAISGIKDAKILHESVIAVEDMESTVRGLLSLA